MLSSFFLVVTAVGNQQTFLGTDGAIFKESFGRLKVQDKCLRQLGLGQSLGDVTTADIKKAMGKKINDPDVSEDEKKEMITCMGALIKVKEGGCEFRDRCWSHETSERVIGGENLCCPFNCSKFDNNFEHCTSNKDKCTWRKTNRTADNGISGFCESKKDKQKIHTPPHYHEYRKKNKSRKTSKDKTEPGADQTPEDEPAEPRTDRDARTPTRDTSSDADFMKFLTPCNRNQKPKWWCDNKSANGREEKCREADFRTKCAGFCECVENKKDPNE